MLHNNFNNECLNRPLNFQLTTVTSLHYVSTLLNFAGGCKVTILAYLAPQNQNNLGSYNTSTKKKKIKGLDAIYNFLTEKINE